MFGTSMTIIIIGYIGYYGYNIVYDLYFNKSGEVVTTAAVDEQEVDIKDELGDFTQFNADEDRGEEDKSVLTSPSNIIQGKTVEQATENTNNDEGETTFAMSGGIKAETLSTLITSLENKEEGSDFDIVAKAMTPSTI
ncbi:MULTISPECIES: hypothetical protein [Prevotella]|jgi:hypothetical protein|uniref:hypothetical protein n=1 Tax=Prevotella TaxID=838 RepID=UPI000C1C5C11|nr:MULTISPECIES: hypothetical protein [Prevotella]ATV39371.1 hypothetical protein CUB95_12415 [Prevotella intermedia]MBW4715422.1 hypothetical protein [Prevotella denticola]MBW4753055.1 hypothetical protein [Prevotella denticola]MBW4760708.1 hypothetical protein [Prevotella denticola]